MWSAARATRAGGQPLAGEIDAYRITWPPDGARHRGLRRASARASRSGPRGRRTGLILRRQESGDSLAVAHASSTNRILRAETAKRSIFSRLFGGAPLLGSGQTPEWMRDQVAGQAVFFEVEGIPVTIRRNGRVPGSRTKGGVRPGRGAFVVTDWGVVGSGGRVRLVNFPWDMEQGGFATLTLDGEGLHVVFDLDSMHHATSGELRIDFKAEIPEHDLARFPARQLTFSVDPQKVVRLWGSLSKLPE
jgi:hypothetical protein